MLRSNRLLIAAAFGLALLYPVDNNCRAQDRPADSRQKPQADQKPIPNPTPIDLAPLQKSIEHSIERVTRAVESLKDNPEADAEKKRAEGDLEAQREMAQWAQYLFWATVATVFLTVVALGLIWRTLVHTARAADYAKGMLDEAAKTTKAATTSLAITERNAKAELRAYVFPSEATITGLNDASGIEITFKIKNFGQTPAYRVSSIVHVFIGENPLRNMRALKDTGQGVTCDLGPDQNIKRIVHSPALNESQKEELRRPDKGLYIQGVLTYKDAFNEHRTTEFIRAAPADLKNGLMSACYPGDNAT